MTTPQYSDLGTIQINVQRVVLYQEGVSALADWRLNDDGMPREPQVPYYVSVVDCGNNTLDWATTRPDGALEPLLTRVRDFGLADAMDQLTATVNDRFGTSYTRSQLVETLIEHHYHLPRGRDLVSVMDLAQTYLARVADEVIAVIHRLHRDSQARIGLVLLAGGGAAVLEPWLTPALATLPGVESKCLPDPLYANARGYYKRIRERLLQERVVHA